MALLADTLLNQYEKANVATGVLTQAVLHPKVREKIGPDDSRHIENVTRTMLDVHKYLTTVGANEAEDGYSLSMPHIRYTYDPKTLTLEVFDEQSKSHVRMGMMDKNLAPQVENSIKATHFGIVIADTHSDMEIGIAVDPNFSSNVLIYKKPLTGGTKATIQTLTRKKS